MPGSGGEEEEGMSREGEEGEVEEVASLLLVTVEEVAVVVEGEVLLFVLGEEEGEEAGLPSLVGEKNVGVAAVDMYI